MSKTSKSPRTVALTAIRVGERKLPRYAHRYAPKIYTQPQLLACLALKEFFKTDYRGIVAYLHDLPDLCAAIGLTKVPHYTTLQKAAHRFLRFSIVRKLLEATLEMVLGSKKSKTKRITIELAAGDSTGFESGRISPYYVRRRARGQPKKTLKNPLYQTTKYTRFPKLAILVDCRTHLILAAWPTRGPTPDIHQLESLLNQLPPSVRIRRLFLDAGYDSHANHVRLREERGILSYIPPHHGRPTTKPATSPLRRLMQRHFATDASRRRIKYGQRWQVETVFSMMKRNLSDAIDAREYWSQCREMLLLAITHNIMILLHALWYTRFSTEQDRFVYYR